MRSESMVVVPATPTVIPSAPTVIPAQAGIQEVHAHHHLLDSRLRGNDGATWGTS